MNTTPLAHAAHAAEAADSAGPTVAERLARRCAHMGDRAFTAREYGPVPVRHIVLLRFADGVPTEKRDQMIERFLRLKDDCRRDGRPYIRSIEYGQQESGEGNVHGFEHAFVVTFDSEGDRNYYTGEPIVRDATCFDPVHHAFKAAIGPMLAPNGVLVFDFFPGAR